jgi:hypothetical protein
VANLKNPSRVDIDDYVTEPEPEHLTPEVIRENTKPQRKPSRIVSVSRQPQVDVIRSDLYSAMLWEAKRLREKAVSEPLDEFEFGRLVRLSEAMTRVSKDQREQDKADNVEELTDEALEEAILVAAERRKSLKP